MNSNDYLKYWRVIRYYYMKKNNLSSCEFDLLLFLKSEYYFRKRDFTKLKKTMSWNDKSFENLLNAGWIQLFRGKGGPKGNIYELSMKASRLVNEVYNKLNGEEIRVAGNNRFTKSKKSFHDKMYLNMIEDMNKSIQQQRHQTHEL